MYTEKFLQRKRAQKNGVIRIAFLKNEQKQPSIGVLRKKFLKICNKFTGEHPRRSVISIKMQSNFIEITCWHGCSRVTLLHIFRTPPPENTSGALLLNEVMKAY